MISTLHARGFELVRRITGSESRGLLAPHDHPRVLPATEHAIELWIVENTPQAINRFAGGFGLVTENAIHSSKHEAQGRVIALVDSLSDGRHGDDRAETRDRAVIRKVVAQMQIHPKDVLGITQRLLDYAITLHAARTLGKSHGSFRIVVPDAIWCSIWLDVLVLSKNFTSGESHASAPCLAARES